MPSCPMKPTFRQRRRYGSSPSTEYISGPSIASMAFRKRAPAARLISLQMFTIVLRPRLERDGAFPVRISTASSRVIIVWNCSSRATTAAVWATVNMRTLGLVRLDAVSTKQQVRPTQWICLKPPVVRMDEMRRSERLLARIGLAFIRCVLQIELMQLGPQQFLVREVCLVLGNQGRRYCAAESIFDHLVVFAGAEQNSDGRAFMRFADIAIESFQIKRQFPNVLGLESTDFEFNRHEAVQTSVEEKQINCKITAAHLQGEFRSHEAEIPPEFSQKLLQLEQQGAMEIFLGMRYRQIQELEHVGIFEDAQRLGMSLCHRWRHFWRTEDGSFKQGRFQLPFKFALAPPFLCGEANIEFSLILLFGLAQNDQVMRPRQL